MKTVITHVFSFLFKKENLVPFREKVVITIIVIIVSLSIVAFLILL